MAEKNCMADNEKPMLKSDFSEEHGTDSDLTVMTYNVQFFSGRNTESTAAQTVRKNKNFYYTGTFIGTDMTYTLR